MGWGFEFIEALMLGGTGLGLAFDESYEAMLVWKSSKLIGGRKSNEGGVGEFAFSDWPKLKRWSLERSWRVCVWVCV